MRRPSLALAAASLLAACASGGTPAPEPLGVVATASAEDLTVDLLAERRLETGLSRVAIAVRTTSGARVTDAGVTFVPVMEMDGGYRHGAPVLAPPAADADGLHTCGVVFQMPSVAGGAWTARVAVSRPGLATVEVRFASLPVAESGRARTFTQVDPVTAEVASYVASLDLEAAPRVGLNPVAFTLHRMIDPLTFAPVDDATVALDPQMPSMGHGSPGSVDPTLASPGLYRGQLSLSMAGAWETTVTVRRAGAVAGTPTFALAF
jgi:hypothetical protein